MNNLVLLGRFFYRYRNIIALPFFVLLVLFSQPGVNTIFAHAFVAAGVLIRLWAAGHIGEKARGRAITAEKRIISGPYYVLKHPLYLGNLFLVSGTILLYNPVFWLGLLIIAVFLLEYSIIIYAEESNLKQLRRERINFSLKNLKGEISTIIILILVYAVYFLKHLRY